MEVSCSGWQQQVSACGGVGLGRAMLCLLCWPAVRTTLISFILVGPGLSEARDLKMNKKYTIRSIVCEAFCHPVIWVIWVLWVIWVIWVIRASLSTLLLMD